MRSHVASLMVRIIKSFYNYVTAILLEKVILKCLWKEAVSIRNLSLGLPGFILMELIEC